MKIKCVIWDLDDTIWEGNLKYSNKVELKPKIQEIIKELNNRGIIQSIASKNYKNDAIKKLEALDLNQYFVYPQISYDPKAILVKSILEFINIDEEFVAYVDDDEFELNEIKKAFPNIKIYKSEEYLKFLNLSEFQVNNISDDSKKRTEYYKIMEKRIADEKEYIGLKEDFMRNSRTVIKICKFDNSYLNRVVELIDRTNKYNNGINNIVTKEHVLEYLKDRTCNIIVCSMKDKYGDYGIIGCMFFRKIDSKMVIDTFCISCRVLGRGIAVSIFSNVINNMFEKRKIKEVVCKVNYTKRNRESIVLLNLLKFDLINKDNDLFTFNLNRKADISNNQFIKVIFEGDN